METLVRIALVADPRAKRVLPLMEGLEDHRGLRMTDWLAAVVGHEVLF